MRPGAAGIGTSKGVSNRIKEKEKLHGHTINNDYGTYHLSEYGKNVVDQKVQKVIKHEKEPNIFKKCGDWFKNKFSRKD